MYKDIIVKALEGEFENNPKDNFDGTRVFSIKGKEGTLKYWNSNNSSTFDHDYVLKELAVKIVTEEEEGTIYEPYRGVDIMWEIR